MLPLENTKKRKHGGTHTHRPGKKKTKMGAHRQSIIKKKKEGKRGKPPPKNPKKTKFVTSDFRRYFCPARRYITFKHKTVRGITHE